MYPKKHTLLIPLLLAACGDIPPNQLAASSCASAEFLGSWTAYPGGEDTLTFDAGCSGQSVMCESRFSFTLPDPYTEEMRLTVHSTLSHLACLPIGQHRCTLTILSETYIRLNCGSGNLDYRR